MKSISKIFAALIVGSAISVHAADANGWATTDETLNAFSKTSGQTGYVKPIVNIIGNVLNSNWYTSASVPQSFAFDAGLPFALVPITDSQRNYTKKLGLVSADFPTIFGDKGEPALPGITYGTETLNGLPVLPYPFLQLGFSYYHARIALRGMWLPAISELKGFSTLGAGIQYSFGHLFQEKLPAPIKTLDVSAVFGYTSNTIKYQPDNYGSPMILDISALTADVVIGYKPIKEVEILMTLGYQYANMEASGDMKYKGSEFVVRRPDVSVNGNNGFKFGLEVAFTLGNSYRPVLGFDYAGQSSFTTNVLYFQQQFGKE